MLVLIKKVINGFIYKLSPIKANRIVFSSLEGQYSDSPKAISESFHNMHPNFQIVWLLKKENFKKAPEYVTAIDINSILAHYYSGSAKIVIDNVYAENAITIFDNNIKATLKAKVHLWFHRKKKQLIFSTWHGTPIKKLGIDQVNNHITDFCCNKITMILGDQYTLDIMRRITFNRMEMQLIGTARNDILFKKEYAQSIKKKLGLQGKKIVLFAPTFRGSGLQFSDRDIEKSGLDQINSIDFDELFRVLSEKFGGEWVFVCRFHYHVAEKVDWGKIQAQYNGQVINGNILQDMADYLSCADILVSDVSSCMFDFALTQKPCFTFFLDKEYYENSERGLYINLEDLPFPFAENYDELLSNIKDFDNSTYKAKLSANREVFGFVDEGNSAEKIINFILDRLKEEEF